MEKPNKTKYVILLMLFIISLLSSIILSTLPSEEICGGTQNTCYVVQSSGYEETLGTKNSNFGIVAFGVLSFLTFSQLNKQKKYKKQLILLGTIIGTIFAIYFLYIQFFILKALCTYCMVVDSATIAGLCILLGWKEK